MLGQLRVAGGVMYGTVLALHLLALLSAPDLIAALQVPKPEPETLPPARPRARLTEPHALQGLAFWAVGMHYYNALFDQRAPVAPSGGAPPAADDGSAVLPLLLYAAALAMVTGRPATAAARQRRRMGVAGDYLESLSEELSESDEVAPALPARRMHP
jgi:hypothetical protein